MSPGQITVLVNAGPWLPLPSPVGGVEDVISTLIPQLRQRGVRVVLASVGQSTLPADEHIFAFTTGQHRQMGAPWSQVSTIPLTHMGVVLERIAAGGIDLVHDHVEGAGPALLAALGDRCPPVVHTLHWRTEKFDGFSAFYERFDGHHRVHFVTRDLQQRASLPPRLSAQTTATVPNAVTVPAFDDRPPRDGQMLMLADLTPIKGQDVLGRLCAQVGAPLILGGPLCGCHSPEQVARRQRDDPQMEALPVMAWYDQHVAPLHERGIRWVGTLTGPGKWDTLRAAPALLSAEGHGQAVSEALALGIPVVAPRPAPGAMCQIRHGVNGYLIDPTPGSLADALERLPLIDSAACQDSVADRTPAAMAAGYLAAYQHLLRTVPPAAQ